MRHNERNLKIGNWNIVVPRAFVPLARRLHVLTELRKTRASWSEQEDAFAQAQYASAGKAIVAEETLVRAMLVRHPEYVDYVKGPPFWFYLLVLLVGTITAQAAPIDDAVAVRAIVGEAQNQKYVGMYAVACAIRNRGSVRGVYGKDNLVLKRTPPYIWRQAQQAWAASATGVDIVKGADHWENVRAYGVPYWAKTMTATTNIGAHTFYKQVRKSSSAK